MAKKVKFYILLELVQAFSTNSKLRDVCPFSLFLVFTSVFFIHTYIPVTMEETVYIRNEIKEEVRNEYVSDCKFQHPCENEIDVTYSLDCVKYESVYIKNELLEPVSCSVVKDEGQHFRIKTDIKDEYFCDSKNGDFEIAMEEDGANNISTVEDIKSQEIDVKYEPLEDIRLSSTENSETLSVARTGISDEVTEANNIVGGRDLNVIEDKATASSSEAKYKYDAEVNAAVNICLETPMYDCNICTYKTLSKSRLRRHMLVHTDFSKIAKYECDICTYKTRWKKGLQNHKLVHTDLSETAKYECNTCPYKSRRAGDLRRHMLVHTDPSKSVKYECNTCSYKAWFKADLQNHMLVHVDSPMPGVYQCNICVYKTWKKPSLRRHMLVHTELSAKATYDCDTCAYKTVWKRNLERHMLTHAETAKYECNTCSFKARWKGVLRKHMLVHTNPKRKNVQV